MREAKGAKKVILQNLLGAKYDRILQPMAGLVLVPEQARQVNKRYMYMETLFHELSHSLGPGSIVVGGRKTSVDAELKDVGSGFEEAKADVMGAYNVLFMMDKGVLPAADKPQIRAAYVVGLFRAMRFGDTDAHGRGAAMQYRYLRDKGGIVWDAEAKRFRIDPAKLDAGIRDLVGDIVRLQGNGDYAGTKAFLAKYAVMDAEAKQVTGTMGHIPVDIRPVYPAMHESDAAAAMFKTFAALHVPGNPVVLYNIWDVGSAQAVVAAGAKALATGSHPVADANGWPDGQQVPIDFALRQRQADRRCGRLAGDGRFRKRLFGRSQAGRGAMSSGWRRPARSAAISRTR